MFGSGASGTFTNCAFTSNVAVSRCSRLEGTRRHLTLASLCGFLFTACVCVLQPVRRGAHVNNCVEDLRQV